MRHGLLAWFFLLGTLGSTAEPVSAQTWFSLTDVRGSIGARLLRNWKSDQTFPAGAYNLQTTEFASLEVDGVILHPGAFRFGVTLQPQWTQIGGTSTESSSLRDFGWSAHANVLQNSRPYWLTLNGGRSTTVRQDRTGFETERWVSYYGARFDAQLPGLPTKLLYRHKAETEGFTTGSPLTFTNRSLALEARNRKTQLLVQRFWWTQASNRKDAQWVASLGHRHGWGRGSSWSSRLSFVDGLGRRSLQWSEIGRIRHAQRVQSSLSFQYRNTRSDAAGRSVWSAGYGMSYPVGPGLVGRSNVSSRWVRGRIERQRELSVGQSVGFGYRLFGSVRLGGGGSVQYLRGQAEATDEGLADVVGEERVVGADGSFLLENPRVEAASVRIFSGDRAILYEAGLDYELLPSGAFTLVTLAPASRIAPGDTVQVDYAYASPASGPLDHLTLSANARASVGPAETFVRLRRAEPLSELPSGSTGGLFLRDLSELEFGLRIAGSVPLGSGRVAVTRIRRTSGDYAFSATSVSGGINVRLPQQVRVGLGGGMSWSGDPGNLARTLNISGGANWEGLRWLRTRAHLGAWSVTRLATDDTRRNIGGGIGATLTVALVTVAADFQARTWNDVVGRADNRVTIWVRRRF
jgi:hypothetical protein